MLGPFQPLISVLTGIYGFSKFEKQLLGTFLGVGSMVVGRSQT